jgi:hypothetical protein
MMAKMMKGKIGSKIGNDSKGKCFHSLHKMFLLGNSFYFQSDSSTINVLDVA